MANQAIISEQYTYQDFVKVVGYEKKGQEKPKANKSFNPFLGPETSNNYILVAPSRYHVDESDLGFDLSDLRRFLETEIQVFSNEVPLKLEFCDWQNVIMVGYHIENFFASRLRAFSGSISLMSGLGSITDIFSTTISRIIGPTYLENVYGSELGTVSFGATIGTFDNSVLTTKIEGFSQISRIVNGSRLPKGISLESVLLDRNW